MDGQGQATRARGTHRRTHTIAVRPRARVVTQPRGGITETWRPERVDTPGRHHADTPPAPPAPPAPRPNRRWLYMLLASVAALATTGTLLVVFWPEDDPTGTLVSPPSRGYACRQGGPSYGHDPACLAAAALEVATDEDDTGLGDGTGVRIDDVAGRHREVIPDSRLCSAGRERYRGFDLARADWPATTWVSGERITLDYRMPSAYRGTVTYYLTRPGYDASKPLTWESLDPKPIGTAHGSPGKGGHYRIDVRAPARTGRQLLYAIWQHDGGPEALYACADIVYFGK